MGSIRSPIYDCLTGRGISGVSSPTLNSTPVVEVHDANPYELRASFQWAPEKSKTPEELGIAADPTSIELIPLSADTRVVRPATQVFADHE